MEFGSQMRKICILEMRCDEEESNYLQNIDLELEKIGIEMEENKRKPLKSRDIKANITQGH